MARKRRELLVLPPFCDGVGSDGNVRWRRVPTADYKTMGRILCYHLIVEHYLETYLKTVFPHLRWETTRLTFNHKLELLSGKTSSPLVDFGLLPGLQQLNSIRNRLSHRLDAKISMDDLKPFLGALRRWSKSRRTPTTNPVLTIEHFAILVCATLGGGVWSHTSHQKSTWHQRSRHL